MRLAVTAQARSHREGGDLGHDVHPPDIAVAVVTTDARLHMDQVREVNEIGKFVHPFPEEGLTARGRLSQTYHSGFVCRRGLVAVHADSRRRDRRVA